MGSPTLLFARKSQILNVPAVNICYTMEGLASVAFNRSVSQFTRIFLLIALAEIASHFVIDSFPIIHYVTKPLVVISLWIFFTWNIRSRDLGLKWGIGLALAFSLIGDVSLMFQGPPFFLGGLSAFLIAHICYIYVFTTRCQPAVSLPLLKRKPWLIIFFVLYGLTLLAMVYSGLGEMILPVCVYALVILSMGLSALNRWKRVSQDSFSWVFLGALLFMLSDSLIAIAKFAFVIPFSQTWIMLTYMGAQYLIVIGIMRQVRTPRPQIPAMN